jgi:hypothetical protein
MMNQTEKIHNSSLINHNSSGAIIHGDNLEALKSLLPKEFMAKKNIIFKKYRGTSLDFRFQIWGVLYPK